MAEERDIIIDVNVEGNVDEAIGEINTELKENRKQIKELSKDYENNATEIASLERSNRELSKSKRQLIKESNIEKGSLNDLRAELSKLTKQRNDTNLSTKEGREEADRLNAAISQLNTTIKAEEQAGGDFRRNVGNYPDLFRGAADGAKSFGGSLGAVSKLVSANPLGLLLLALPQLSEALNGARGATTAFKTVLEALGLAVKDFFEFIGNNAGTITNFFKDIFDNPLESVKALGNIIKDNLIERFNSFIEVIGLAGKAISQVFEGDFTGALETAQEAGKEYIDVLTGIDNTFDRTVDAVVGATDAIAEYATETFKAAQANVELAESAELVEAQNKILFESFDQQAEQLRQIRDEERNSIDARIQANNDLSEVLEKQQQLQLEQIDIAIRAAKLRFERSQSLEDEKELLEQLAERQAILADIEGRRSEQLANDLALNREKLELDQSLIESTNRRELAEREFEASRIEDINLREERLLENLEFEVQIERERIQSIIDANKEGTQARQDAEQELLDFESEAAMRRVQITDATVAAQTKISENATKKEIELEKAKNNAAQDLAVGTLSLIGEVAGEGTAVAKVAASIQAGINTAQGITAALGAAPPPFNFALAALTGAAGAVQIAKINSTSTDVKSGGLSSAPTRPSGNIPSSTGLANVNASLLGQFSETAQQTEATTSGTASAVSNIPAPQVAVTDINTAQDNRSVKVTETSL